MSNNDSDDARIQRAVGLLLSNLTLKRIEKKIGMNNKWTEGSTNRRIRGIRDGRVDEGLMDDLMN